MLSKFMMAPSYVVRSKKKKKKQKLEGRGNIRGTIGWRGGGYVSLMKFNRPSTKFFT